MRALKRVVDLLDAENRRIALAACLFVDGFRQNATPANLQDAQDFIRLGLLDTRSRLRTDEARRPQRRNRFAARRAREASLARHMKEHLDLLEARVQTLERRRTILRSAADGLAWIALSHQPSAIPRLFRPQTHDLPEQRGLIGPLLVQHAAHRSGRFLVLENDLTRCLGLGDLTVISIDARDVPPISIEVKD